mgnify:CR=1 FL=1
MSMPMIDPNWLKGKVIFLLLGSKLANGEGDNRNNELLKSVARSLNNMTYLVINPTRNRALAGKRPIVNDLIPSMKLRLHPSTI